MAIFFYGFVHILMVPNSTDYFIGLLVLLAVFGLIVIYKITGSLIYLTEKIKNISDKNLDERVLEPKNDDEIAVLSREFNELLDRLSDAFTREQQFIGDVAHELKTPLAVMKTTLEVARTDNKTLILEIDRLSGTINNVLDLAWSNTPKAKTNKEVFNLSNLMEELADIAQKLGQTKNIKVQAIIDKNITILGFRDKFARAVLNIIDNAVKYTRPDKMISISLEQVNNRVLIAITDQGPGIKKTELPHIFDRFYRGSKTQKTVGSGLGLAISKAIISLHGGDIKVKTLPAHGSTFVIVVPSLRP